MTRTAATALAVTTLLATALAGCTGDATPDPSADAKAFAERVATVKDIAAAEGANDAQLALLDEVAAAGEVTMEQLLTARDAYAACLSAGGYRLEDQGITEESGFPYPDYRIADLTGADTSADTDTGPDYMTQCENSTFTWIDMLYQTQPAAADAANQKFIAAMPAMIACLNDGGLEVDQTVTPDELRQILNQDMQDHLNPGNDGVQSERELLAITCMSASQSSDN